jgi:hypothetical protein
VELWRRLAGERQRCEIVPGQPPALALGAFRDYPTRVLAPGDVVTLTATEAAAAAGERLRLHGELAGVLSPAALERILAAAREPVAVGALRQDLGEADFHVAWLLKQGLLALRG